MINSLIEWSLRNRLVVAGLSISLVILGLESMLSTPVDALPDLSEQQVIVSADWMGRGPQEVETQVTQPLALHLHFGGLSAHRSVPTSGGQHPAAEPR